MKLYKVVPLDYLNTVSRIEVYRHPGLLNETIVGKSRFVRIDKEWYRIYDDNITGIVPWKISEIEARAWVIVDPEDSIEII